jgi:hypothetical protein
MSATIGVSTWRRSWSPVIGRAVAGTSATTVCLRWKTSRGFFLRLAYQPRGPGVPVRYQRPPSRWNTISTRRGSPVLAP